MCIILVYNNCYDTYKASKLLLLLTSYYTHIIFKVHVSIVVGDGNNAEPLTAPENGALISWCPFSTAIEPRHFALLRESIAVGVYSEQIISKAETNNK